MTSAAKKTSQQLQQAEATAKAALEEEERAKKQVQDMQVEQIKLRDESSAKERHVQELLSTQAQEQESFAKQQAQQQESFLTRQRQLDAAVEEARGEAEKERKLRAETERKLAGEPDVLPDATTKAWQKLSTMLLKGLAGTVRLLFEDLINGGCQIVFLIKGWPSEETQQDLFQTSTSQMVFTSISLVVGISLGVYGLYKDYKGYAEAQAFFPDARCCHVLSGTKGPQRYTENVSEQVASQPLVKDVDHLYTDADSELTDEAPAVTEASLLRVYGQSSHKGKKLPLVLSSYRIEEFLLGKDKNARHWRLAHRCLIVSSALFWLAMASLPFFFCPDIKHLECDEIDDSPTSAVVYFFLVISACMLVELWVVLHTHRGLHFIQHPLEHMEEAVSWSYRQWFCCYGRCGGTEHDEGDSANKAAGMIAGLLGLLGRYDTFSDIFFAMMLCSKHEIKWFTIKGHTFFIPGHTLGMTLFHWSLFAVVVGVFLLQAIPGMVLLYLGKNLPMAFKFNELNFLLAITELEVQEKVEFEMPLE